MSLRERMRRAGAGSIVRAMATMLWQWARIPGRTGLGGDRLIAVALAAGMAGAALGTGHASLGARTGAAIASAGLLVLVLRRRRPLLVVVVAFSLVFVQELISPHAYGVASFLAIMVATYSLGAHGSRLSLAAGIVLSAGGVAIGHALGEKTNHSDVSSDAFFLLILVVGPVLVGRLVRARSDLAGRLRDATKRLAAARSERLSAALAADREQLTETIDAALLEGLAPMVAHAECATLAQVSALEQIARALLSRMRTLLKDLRSGEEAREPAGSITELHTRVQRAIEAEAALVASPRADAALPGSPGTDVTRPRRWALLSTRAIDGGLTIVAAVVTAGLLASTVDATALHGPRWAEGLLGVAAGAPIAFARRFALQATAVSVLSAFAYVALARPGDPTSGWLPTGALIVFPFALGATCALRTAAAGLVLCLAQVLGLGAVDAAVKLDSTTVGPGVALAVGAWVAGRVLRDRTQLLGSLADTAVGIEDERERLAKSAVAAERARVARELHDAVAHAMTVIVLQAGAARRVWHTDSRLAREHATALRNTVSEVITELRGMLVALGDGERPDGTPGVERLVKWAERSGMHVELETGGDRSQIGSAVEHTAYRVLQEALTNAARHAPGADVLVRLHFERSGLMVEITNGAPALVPRHNEGAGHGLRGMRERVEGLGGSLSARREPAGGFAVSAWLPCT